MVVLEKTSGPKAGTYVDLVGTYNPKTKLFQADGEKIKGWVSKGAQLSPSLSNLLIDKKIIEGKKVQVISEKNLGKNIKKAAEEAAAAAAAAPAPVAEAPAAEASSEEVVEAPIAEAEPAPEESAPEAPAEAAPEVAEAPAEETAPAA